MAINSEKLNEFLGNAVLEFRRDLSWRSYAGDELGLYKTLGSGGSQTLAELAKPDALQFDIRSQALEPSGSNRCPTGS
jgi:hypothetical protein